MSLKPPTIPLTRRRFLAAAGLAAIAAKASALQKPFGPAPRFAYTASSGELRIYSTHTTPWTHLQSFPSEAPTSLVIDTRTHTLHVLHDVAEYQGLPRGYVESFRVDHRTGRLTPLHRQPLSLSAIHPRHMAISPDGKFLAVAIHGGSAYNLLPILEDGRPGRPHGIRKEIGLSTSSPSRPSQIAFNPAGDRIFALDQGTATLSVFAAEPELPLLAHFHFPAGSDPLRLVMDPEGQSPFVISPRSRTLHMLSYESSTRALQASQLALPDTVSGPFALHAPTRSIIAAHDNALRTFQFNPDSMSLESKQTIYLPDRPVREIIAAESSDTLFAVTGNEILKLALDRYQGKLSGPQTVGPAAYAVAFI